MGLLPNWCLIGSKACYIPKVSKFCIKNDIYSNSLKNVVLSTECVFNIPEHNPKWRPHETEFLRC